MRFAAIITFLFSFAVASAQVDNDRALADQYLNNYEYEKAAAIYDKLFDKDPYGTYNNYLRTLLALKNYDEAEKIVKKVSKKQPGNLAYQVDMGFIYQSRGQTDKAKQIYAKAIKALQPDQGQIIMLANAFYGRQDWDNALATYSEGRKLLRGNYNFNYEIADLYYQKQDYAKMIDEYLNAVQDNPNNQQTVQNILQSRLGNDADNTRSDFLRQALLRRVQRNPDQPVYSEMLIWLFVQQKDFESALIQAKALDKRQREEGDRIMMLGNLADNNEDYDVAIKCYQYVIDKDKDAANYIPARMQLLNVKNKKLTRSNAFTQQDLLLLESDYKNTLAELGKDGQTAPLIRGLAHLQVFYLDKIDEAITNLEEAIAYPNISRQVQADCKLELGDIYLFTGNVWDSDLMYAQVDKMFKNDPMGQEAKFRSARLDYYRGDFSWSQAQLDVLKSATSQLIANDALYLSLLISDNMGPDSTNEALMAYSKADLLSFRNKYDDALVVLDSLERVFPDHSLIPYSMFKRSDIMDIKKNYVEEDSLLKHIVEKYADGVLADDALFNRAELYERKLSDKTKAMELYQDLLTKYPGSLYVVEARKRFRTQRGDAVN